MNDENVEFRRLLKVSGWRQARAAAELGLSTGTVSQYVSDKTIPSITVLRLFGALIGESVRLPGETPSAQGAPFVREKWEDELVSAIRLIPADRRKHVADSIRVVLSAYDGTVNKSPLNQASGVGTESDPVLDKLHQQAKAIVKKLVDDRKYGDAPRRKPQNEPPS